MIAAWQTEEPPEVKRRRLEIKLESDDANDNFTFPDTVRQTVPRAICMPIRGRSRVVSLPVTLTSQLSAASHSSIAQLLIVCQPEQQHRARYQTEGSRGAVKDRTGNGFPVVKLVGYDRPATLQVFIGTDQGRVAPHMFYQACRVSGKNSTPCVEKKIDGTIVIEVDVEPSKDMVVTCDCVGILKERNVDVEHRFPEEGSGRSKKKSTRCRMVFRTTITNPDGSQETLQVTSQPIVCTQPPGVPEICKKSLTSCNVRGGQELFILGKNFLKDTRVVFQEGETASPTWSQSVQPDKEFLQQSHLVCVVPPYRTTDISEPVSVRLVVESSGKASEPHTFLYLPDNLRPTDTSVLASDGNLIHNSVIAQGGSGVLPAHLPVASTLKSAAPTFLAAQTSPGANEKMHTVMMWEKSAADVMMPPPAPLPITVRRSSIQMIVPDPLAPEDLKQEESPDPPKPVVNVPDLSNPEHQSMENFHRFVSSNSLPSINVGNYLSNIEANSIYTSKVIKPQIMNDMPRIIIPSPPSVNKPIFPSDSSNLLTTVKPGMNQSVTMPFDGRNISVNSSVPEENLSVIVSSSMIQKKCHDTHMTQDVQLHKPMPETQNVGMDLLMSSSSIEKRAPTMTERLDAFVNSAAESHISPTQASLIGVTSVITENSVISPINEMVVNGTNNVQASPLPISPHTSPHHGSTNINGESLCSILNSTVKASPELSSNQGQANIQASLNLHLNNQNVNTQTNINNIVHTSSQDSASHSGEFSSLHASLKQQLSSQSVSSSQMNDISTLMQSSTQQSTSQAQRLADFKQSLEQQLSPQAMNSNQLNHSNITINNLIQPTQQTSVNQSLSNLQMSLEQGLAPQNMNTSQMSHSDLSNLIQTTQSSRSDNISLNNLQVSLEQHLSPPSVNSTQIIQSESVQSGNLSLNNMTSGIHTTNETSTSDAQALSNLQASLERHLSSQVMASVQSNHESLSNGSISNPQIQAVVSEAQAISNIQASLEHHLQSQVLGSAQTMLESMASSNNTSSIMNSSMDATSATNDQSQSLSNLQMSLGLTSQVLTSVQSSHESVTSGNLNLNNAMQNLQPQIATSQTQALSNFQASLNHLTSQVMGVTQSPSETIMPLERLNDSIQTSQPSSNQSLSSLQASIDHLSSQVLNSSQPTHTDSLSSDNMSVNNCANIDLALMNSQSPDVSGVNQTNGNIRLSSPTSHHSPASVLSPPGISISNASPMVLSPTNLTMHNSQPVKVNSPNMVLASPQNLMATDLSANNSSSHTITPTDLQIQNAQSTSLQPNNMSQFEQVTSGLSQNMSVQVGGMNHYNQCEELQSTNNQPERKDTSGYIIPTQTAMNVEQGHREFEIKEEAPMQTVKKYDLTLAEQMTQLSDHDLISYINPSCFDTV